MHLRGLLGWAALGLPMALGVGLPLTGCRKASTSAEHAPEATSRASTAAPLPDEVAPGELAEGQESAFGLRLPRRMEVVRRFDQAVFARGKLPPEDVLTYVQKRVEAALWEVGPRRSGAQQALLRGAPEQRLALEIHFDGVTTTLVVRDLRRPPPPPGLTDEERWRAAGLRPDGRPLDPSALQ